MKAHRIEMWLRVVQVLVAICASLMVIYQSYTFVRDFRQLVNGGKSERDPILPYICDAGKRHWLWWPHTCICEFPTDSGGFADKLESENIYQHWRLTRES